MIYSGNATDFGSRIVGISTPSGMPLFPIIVRQASVSSGSVWSRVFYPYSATYRTMDKTIAVSGLTQATDYSTAFDMMTNLLIGAGQTISGSITFNMADGGSIEAVSPVMIGGSLAAVGMAGSKYLKSSVSVAAKYINFTAGSNPSFVEKAAANDAPYVMTPSVQLPIAIRFSDTTNPSSPIVYTLGNSGSYNVNDYSTNFFITTISSSTSAPDTTRAAQFMPYGLEQWSVNPVEGKFAGYSSGASVPPGHPLTVTREMIASQGAASPAWSDYGISISGGQNLAMGVVDSSSYWQVAYPVGTPQFKVTLSVSGFFFDASFARWLLGATNTMNRQNITIAFLNPSNSSVLASFSNAVLASHSVEEDVAMLDGKPAIGSTLTFEYMVGG